jgi:hypothetical protein
MSLSEILCSEPAASGKARPTKTTKARSPSISGRYQMEDSDRSVATINKVSPVPTLQMLRCGNRGANDL